jgi:outer membrane protein OmpA-like peptidoglycan-associated protein
MVKDRNNKKILGKFFIASVLSAFTVACSGSQHAETSNNSEPSYVEITTEHEFAIALQDAYFNYATKAFDIGDTVSADYYALRSIMATEGKIVKPSEVSPEEMGAVYQDAESARQRLVAQLDSGARTNAPYIAAQAQAAFDCWLRETAKAQEAKANVCRTETLSSVQQVEVANKSSDNRVASTRPFVNIQNDATPAPVSLTNSAGSADTEVKGMVVETPSSIPPKIIPSTTKRFNDEGQLQTASLQPDVGYISPLVRASMPRKGDHAVYFGFDSSEITMEAEDILIDIIQEVKKHKTPIITIMGHTDTIGSNRYNELLSLRRAQEVRKFLKEQLPANVTYRISALGESDPVIGVGDRITQTANRRVEVALD